MHKLISRTAAVSATTLALALLPAASQAAGGHQRPHAYLGGGFGYLRVEEDNLEVDDDKAAYKLFGGAQLHPIAGAEVSYVDFGESEGNLGDIDANGFTLAGTAAIPVTPHFAPYAKLGVLFWDVDFNSNVAPAFNGGDDGEDPFFGVGVRFRVVNQLLARIEYERYELDDTDVDLATANLQYSFF